MRTIRITAAILLASGFLALVMTVPPAPAAAAGALDASVLAATIPGAYHVHSRASDGSADRETIAAAAARAGLRFVVFTDHGDGTRAPEAPRYAHGVLCLDAVEISSSGGHYVALDMRPSPYPLGGEASAVIEDVRRLGGFGIAAHPYSAKQELKWTDWDALFDGIEWLNADSEWRDESLLRLARLPFDYALRPPAALASLLDRPASAVARWDVLTSRRPVVGLAAHDAHGGFSWRRDDGGWMGLPGVPSYEASFRAFAVRALVEAPLTGAADRDARLVLNAIRRGRIFTAIDALAVPAGLEFFATLGGTRAQMGDALPFDPGIELVLRSTMPPGGSLVLVCDGEEVARSTSGELRSRPERPVACRPEVHAPGAAGDPPVPWIVGNAIHLLATMAEPIGREPLYETSLALDSLDWTVEKDPASQGSLSVERGAVTLRYQLRAGERVSQYVAAAGRLSPPAPPFDRILFTAESSAPMRLWVSMRFDGGERWVHSVYVEPDARRAIVPIASLVPAQPGSPSPPDFRNASSILFIVDLTHARPGSAGTVRISDLALARGLR